MTTPALPRRKRLNRPLSFRERRWLLSGQPAALFYLERGRVEQLWREYGGVIVARHVNRHPFSRPVNWWRLSAVEPCRPNETQCEYLKRHALLLPDENSARVGC